MVATLCAVLGPLSACSLATNGTESNLVVDFTDRGAVAARAAVRTGCGNLPGITPVPERARDVSVYFDIGKATSREQNTLATCVNKLAADKSLKIRGYRIEDGSMS